MVGNGEEDKGLLTRLAIGKGFIIDGTNRADQVIIPVSDKTAELMGGHVDKVIDDLEEDRHEPLENDGPA